LKLFENITLHYINKRMFYDALYFISETKKKLKNFPSTSFLRSTFPRYSRNYYTRHYWLAVFLIAISQKTGFSFITHDPALYHPVSQRSNSLVSQLIYVRVAIPAPPFDPASDDVSLIQGEGVSDRTQGETLSFVVKVGRVCIVRIVTAYALLCSI